MARKRYRLQFKFWIDTTQPDGETVADQIELLKNDRSFTSVVKDGIMIVSELRQGRVDTLLRLYPWLTAEISSRQGGSGEGDSEIKSQIERLERILLAQNKGPIMAPPDGPKALSVPKIAGPVAQDDEDMLVVKKSKGTGSASENFLKSAYAVAGVQ